MTRKDYGSSQCGSAGTLTGIGPLICCQDLFGVSTQSRIMRKCKLPMAFRKLKKSVFPKSAAW
jgi:hypothetical protein